MFSDIHLEDRHVGKDRRSVTIFRGQWILCELGRRIGSPLIIRERPKGKLMNKIAKTESNITTENAVFNERFQILSDDPQTAHDILTPSFTNYIISADMAADAQTYMYFGDKWVHIAINSGKDSFELGKGSELTDLPRMQERFKAELRYVTNIIDGLLQNSYLFGDVTE